ncbi:hypothetical protein ACQKWADRAFT_305726 [Trichoderma austrokoningii]
MEKNNKKKGILCEVCGETRGMDPWLWRRDFLIERVVHRERGSLMRWYICIFQVAALRFGHRPFCWTWTTGGWTLCCALGLSCFIVWTMMHNWVLMHDRVNTRQIFALLYARIMEGCKRRRNTL